MRYTVQPLVVGTKVKNVTVLEDGCSIATMHVRRRSGYVYTDFHWYTEAGRRRFDDFCDSISFEECVSALLMGQHKMSW